jgi:CheY-like chemotaxis protein
MGVNALVVSQDVSANNLIASLLLEFRIETQAITDISMAQALLRRAKFAAVIVDYDLPGAELLLGNFASSPSGKSVISFALLSPGDRKGSRVANFALSKPLQEKAIRSTLNVASRMIFSSYRRSFRCPLDVAISLMGGRGTFKARTINISIDGIAALMLDKVSAEDRFAVRFQLPNGVDIQTDGKVVWTDGRRAALLFTSMAEPSKRSLPDWIDAQIQQVAYASTPHGN